MESFLTPESVLRVERMNDTFTKYHLGSGRVLHHFTAAHDEHYHDHPWGFRTSILHGGYVEKIAVLCDDGSFIELIYERLAGTTHEVRADTIHKLTGLLSDDCWTLIEPGEKERDSGFYRADEQGIWHRYWHESDWRLLVPALVPH